MKVTPSRPLQYTVEDAPPIHITALLSFQQFLTMMGGLIAMPLIISEACCVGPDLVGRAQIMGTLMFVNGIATLMQIFLGVRLPIVQGASFAFVVPMMAMQHLEGRECPSDEDYATWKIFPGSVQHRNLWMSRLVEVQGAILVAGILEAVIGSLGLVSYIFRYIGPLTITPTMALIELSLVNEIINEYASKMWPISILAMTLVLACTLYLPKTSVPLPFISIKDLIKKREFKCGVTRLRIFSLFPVLLAIVVSWGLYAILQFYNVIPKGVITDVNITSTSGTYSGELEVAPWFRVPYPGQWGVPQLNLAVTIGMLAAVVSSIIESIGDYIACARMCGVGVPPSHAINRGIAVEGLGCIVAGAFGCGPGVSSYAENVGAIGIMGVASRRVIFATALILLFMGSFTKIATFFVMIPEPVIGGILIAILSMVIAVGFSNLQFVDLNSTRNLLIFGLSIFLGLGVPSWVKANPKFLHTGFELIDEVVIVFLSTGMFVGGAVGFFLDNTVPKDPSAKETNHPTFFIPQTTTDKTYDFPFGISDLIKRVDFFRYFPISPTFEQRLLWNLVCPPFIKRQCHLASSNNSTNSGSSGNISGVITHPQTIPNFVAVPSPNLPSVATVNEAFSHSLTSSRTGSLASLTSSTMRNVALSPSLPKTIPLATEEKWTDI